MSNAISGRLARRFTAMGAGAALVAAGLSLGVMAPANAASVVTGGATDGFGNPVSGFVTAYLQDPDTGTFFSEEFLTVSNDGYIEGTLDVDGVYKFEFETLNDYAEFYKDAADLATAAPITVTAGAPVALGAWTIDQPYVLGTITNATGKPLPFSSVNAFDAATGSITGGTSADEKGNFKIATQSAPVKLSFSAGSDYALEYYADAADLATAYPVTATSTGANLGNITLAAAGSISGQVTSDAGAPLEFIRVALDDDFNSRYDFTDKNGVYTIENAPTGSHVVSFSDPIGEYTNEYFNNVTDEDLATPVTVGVGQAVPSVNAALTPRPVDPTKTVEVAGAIKDNLGAPVVGARLSAVGTPASTPDRKVFESTYSNRQGNYAFTELEKVQGENQFKIYAGGEQGGLVEQGDDLAFALYGSWYGGGQDYDRAPVVTVTPGTAVGPVDFSLERAGGIAGSVTGLAGAPLNPSVSVFGPKDGQFASAGVDFEADSTFESRSLRPGTYKIRFDDFSGFHAGEWWKDQAKVDDAVLVTVKSGQMVGGLNAVLGNKLTASERPMIGDYAWVGKAITADSGVWNLQTDTQFSYEWLVGSTVVGKGSSFTPTTAQIGDRLTLRVTAENGKLLGTATSAATAKVGYQPKIKVKVKGDTASFKIKANPVKAKKIKGSVVVKEIVKVKDDGTIKYKKIAKGKIKKGKGTVSLSKLKKGKHKLVFFFTGKGKVGSNDVTKKVKG